MRNRIWEERSRSLDAVRGAAIPDSEIFNLRPYHTASEALFGCGYRNVGQEKARDGMQQAHGKKKKDFQGPHCTDTSSHGDFATRESISKSKKGEEVDGGDDGFFGQTDR